VSEPTHPAGLWPVPGDGVLARHGSLILLSSLESGQFVDVLLDLLERVASAGGDGREFADQIAVLLESGEASHAAGGSIPSVLAFGAVGSGMAVTVSGGAWADVSTEHGTQRIEAGQPGMLLRCLLRSSVAAVRGGLGVAGSGSASTDRFSRLDAGTVRASGLSFFVGGTVPAVHVVAQPSGPAPQPAAPAVPLQEAPPAPPPPPPPPPRPEPAPEPAAQAAPGVWEEPAAAESGQAALEEVTEPPAEPVAQPYAAEPPAAQPFAAEPFAAQPIPAQPFEPEPFEAVLLNAGSAGADLGAPQRQPLSKARDISAGQSSYVAESPIIEGVYCKNGHFDDPEALFCAVCGISMNQQTLVPRPGTRPPLGVLLLDDGSVFQLDRDYIVGREPGLDGSVASGRARALRITDESGIVSRVHAKVQLDGWRVLVTDLGSANGTRVRLPKQNADAQLQPHVPFVLTTGSQVDLGGRGFRYESHRGR
jgi:hypothetical protein